MQLAFDGTRPHNAFVQIKPERLVEPKIRKAFPDTNYWAPALRTGSDGRAQVRFNFPDSLTTWRATVRAVTADSKFGSEINKVISRKMVSPRAMDQIVHFKLFLVWAFILPITSFPLFSAISHRGFAGWGGYGWCAVLRAIKNWRWCLAYFILFHLAFWFPLRLAHWVPGASTLSAEFMSLILRFTLAYLLAIIAWLLTISATSFSRQE